MDRIKEIYESLKNGKIKAAFIGRNTIKDYLCYVLGNGIQMSCRGSADDLTGEEDVCIFDDVTGRIEGELGDHGVKLSDFVRILNMDTPQIPQDRPVALWGGGDELKARYKTIRKYCHPGVIIDKCKTGTYEGIPFVHPEEIEFKNYFIIITTAKYAGEIKDELARHGCAEGKDYILSLNSGLLNDNAEMFTQTITDRPIRRIACRRPFDYVNVGGGGYLTHCCFQWLPKYIGNVLNDNSGNACDTISSRIIRVSFMNQTYSFCNTVCCPWMVKEREKLIESNDNEAVNPELYLLEQKPVNVDVAFDGACNLSCKSCRKGFHTDSSNETINIARRITRDLIPNARALTLAGGGEVFFSKAYAHILNGVYPNVQLSVLSNGNLFTMDKWKMLEGRFKEIRLGFSIDAATRETYETVRRGGKWDNVMRGLVVASDLRKQEKIKQLTIRFVVSRENYQEMPAFVQLGIDMGCDKVDFSGIENWGTFSDEEFQEVSMLRGDEPKEELQAILDLPIMRNPIVRYTNIPQSTVK